MALQNENYHQDINDDEEPRMPVSRRNYVSDDDSSEEGKEDCDESHEDEESKDEDETITSTAIVPYKSPKVTRAMRNLETSYNPEATRVLARQRQPQPAENVEAGRDTEAGRADTDTEQVTVVEDMAELSSLIMMMMMLR